MKVDTIYIEITNQCNLNCQTCYNQSGLNHQRKELSLEDIQNTIDLFCRYGLKRVLLSGGEPTMHSQFDTILDLVDKYPNILFGIVTNGTNHNSKLIEYLNTKPNIKLQISLDGSCEEQNAKTRGTGHFVKTIEFAKKIHKPAHKPLLKMVISQNNYDDVENFYNLALSLNFTPEFAFIYRSGNGINEWDNKALTSLQKTKILCLIDRLNRETCSEAFLPKCTSKCPYAENSSDLSLCVKVDGAIQPCQALYDEQYSLGNVLTFNKDTFNENLNKIVSLALKRYQTDYMCQKCILNECCGKGCMAEAVNLHSDPLSNDGNCDYRKTQFLMLNFSEKLPKSTL